jgi:RimJ/RimL family protein N-acetyltransferase
VTDLVIRSLADGEEPLFASLPDPGLVGFAHLGRDFLTMAAQGEYRPEWCWVALRAGTVVARAAWWGWAHDTEPCALDWFDFTDPDAAARLLRDAPWRTEYVLSVPSHWRDDPAVRAAVQARLDATSAVGMRILVERYIYAWTPGCGLPDRPGRLEFQPEPDDSVVFALLCEIERDSLDAHSRRASTEYGQHTAAGQDLDILLRMPGPREWWRVAYTTDGAPVGFVAPTRNSGGPNIGFVGVVPAHRGHGYGYDLLVEATHLLVGHGAERITAGTDVGNLPMAAAFARAGFPIRNHRIDLI